ncbi:MAG: preprotein translocase subunit SecG [Bryobacterales bacterium]|nr:preprotein translocase subunit SecG [Bryobacterales bacterium]
MEILLTFIHIVVCLFLIVVVLLQSGKAGDISSAFGGMGSQTAFGPRSGATLLTRATTVSAVVFMLTSLTLTILSVRSGAGAGTILENAAEPAPTEQAAPPAQPQQAQPQFGPSEGGSAPTGAAPAPAPAPDAPKN